MEPSGHSSSLIQSATKHYIYDFLVAVNSLQQNVATPPSAASIIHASSTPSAPTHPLTQEQAFSPRRHSSASPNGGTASYQSPTPPGSSDGKPPIHHKEAQPSSPGTSQQQQQRMLFHVSPNEKELPRHSQRSGRLLSELESLHAKHESEFRVLIPVIGHALKSTMDAHQPLLLTTPRDEHLIFYDTVAAPSISIQQYVRRIVDFTYVSPSTLLCSVILMDRLSRSFPLLLYTPVNIFKLFFVAVRIASKVIDLRSLNNKNFASVGGVSNKHLNDLEARMLMDLRFNLYISQQEFVVYAKKLIAPQLNTAGGSVFAAPRLGNQQSSGSNASRSHVVVVKVNPSSAVPTSPQRYSQEHSSGEEANVAAEDIASDRVMVHP